MYCPGCGEPNARGATRCAACGSPLPVEQPVSPAPAPASPPQILRPPVARPAPLRPPPLDPLPPSGRARPPVDDPFAPLARDAVVPREVSMPAMPAGGEPRLESPSSSTASSSAAAFPTPAPTRPTPIVAPSPAASLAPPPQSASVPRAPTAAPPLSMFVDPPRATSTSPAAVARPAVAPSPPVVASPPSVAVRAPEPPPPPRPAHAPVPVEPRAVVEEALAVDSLAPTLIEDAPDDTGEFNDVTDPGLPPFDDTPDVTAASATGEGSPIDDDDDDVPAPRALPRVSFASPSLARYALASLVDGGITAAPALALAFAIAGDPGAPFLERVIQTLALSPSGLIVFVVGAVIVSAAHHAVLVPRLGATAGGVVTGIGVRSMDGSPVHAVRAATRGALMALTSAVFLAGPLYALWIDDGRRGLADRVARTRLVTRLAGGRS